MKPNKPNRNKDHHVPFISLTVQCYKKVQSISYLHINEQFDHLRWEGSSFKRWAVILRQILIWIKKEWANRIRNHDRQYGYRSNPSNMWTIKPLSNADFPIYSNSFRRIKTLHQLPWHFNNLPEKHQLTYLTSYWGCPSVFLMDILDGSLM